MTNLYLDIRERSITAIITKGDSILYRRHISIGGTEDIQDLIAEILRDSNSKPETAHIIIPSSEVMIEHVTIQNMPIEDAEKVIRRKVISETGARSAMIHVTLLRSERGQQTYMVETIEKERIDKYIKPIISRKIRVKTITTAFHANLRAFVSIDKIGTFGVLDIGAEYIEVTVISESLPVFFERIPLLKPDAGVNSTEIDESRLDKMRLFRIAEKFHNVYTKINNTFSDRPLSKVFLSGPLCINKEIRDILREITEIGLIQEGDGEEDACIYTSLRGLIDAVSDRSVVNFIIPRERPLIILLKKIKRFSILFLILYITTLITAYLFLYKRHKDLNVQFEKETGLLEQIKRQNSIDSERINLLKKSSGRDIPLYEILRYIANELPDGVFLEKVNYRSEDRIRIDFTFILKDTVNIGKEGLLTRLMRMLDNSPYLKRYREPIFSMITKDKEKILQVQVIVEID